MSRSNKYKTVRRTIQPFSYYRKGKLVTIKKPFKRRYHIGKKKPYLREIKGKIRYPKNKEQEKIEKYGEIDIWIKEKEFERFCSDLSSLNDIKIDEEEIIARDRGDIRVSIPYRSFSDKELIFPKQDYYQLKNHYSMEKEDL